MSYNTKKEQTIQHSTIPHCANGATHSTFNIPHSTLRQRRKLCSHLRVFDVHYNRTNALPTPYELMLFFTKR